MKDQWRLYLSLIISIACFTSCTAGTKDVAAGPVVPPTSLYTAAVAWSQATFSLSGATPQSYRLRSTATLSKLRHGHKEFTIDIVDAERSLIIVFYGYSGPATYTLTNQVNGGDVRIASGKQYWDLALIPSLSCALIIRSDTPTTSPGINHMRGQFTCPTLPAGHSNISQHAVAIDKGQFDISILVES
ncbi:hypothetical protein [Dictyobacter aurantiacus]|uniref:Uncharacterized protein n=1 Tax=Dictyobacter aurantiacus TaxID=1936993 RepID=A0A401ZND4_9CHLR|nr:hypothetical protein [Dictyobacter aurantiacus]GCE08324.1 hypothetical protein KDAU_56530 [Dictyobacter aurantiacus]